MENRQVISGRDRVRDRVRYFNRRWFNPFALSFAGRPNSFWSVLLHTGRRSGNAYTTPVVAARLDSSFIIPLPYGRHVDWFRNVMAAGGCYLIYRGRVYQASQPEVISVEAGLAAFSERLQTLLRRSDTVDCLRLKQSTQAPDGEARYQAFTSRYRRERGLWALATLGLIGIGTGHLMSRHRRSKRTAHSGSGG